MPIALTFAAFLSVIPMPVQKERVGRILINGNRWTADQPILDTISLYPGMILPSEAALLRTEIKLLMRFHDRFNLNAGVRPTVSVLRGDAGQFRDILVEFPEVKDRQRRRPHTPEQAAVVAAYGKYVDAVRKCDFPAAKQYWNLDPKSRSLDIHVGFWISNRLVQRTAIEKFGAAGMKALPSNWRAQDVSDRAFALTSKRLADAWVEIRGDQAWLIFDWRQRDRDQFGTEKLLFRKVAGDWRIEPDEIDEQAFAEFGWGSLFLKEIAIMDAAVAQMRSGKLQSPKELKSFIKAEVSKLGGDK